MSNAIIVEEIGRSLVVKFNRPETRNPLSIDVLESLSSIVTRVDENEKFDSLVFARSRLFPEAMERDDSQCVDKS